jgi:triosephosphate isomerase
VIIRSTVANLRFAVFLTQFRLIRFIPRDPRERLSDQMRKKLIAANWKMYKTPDQTREFFSAFLPLVKSHSRDEIVVCPPFIDIAAAVDATKGSNVGVGAQNMYWEKEGAYTGEISANMILSAGCTHVVIGHSERRQYFGETDDTVNQKLKVALDAGLTPIACVGEVLEEREAGITDDVLRRQCSIAFRGMSAERAAKLVIAYEPVWAIGTGKTATPQIAESAHLTIRGEAANAFGKEFAEQVRILYGGSVKPDNAKALMSEEDIDGALVGGASLDPKNFAAIVQY